MVMVVLAGRQAQRVRSEQRWRVVVRVGGAAQAQRVRSHEVRRGRGGRRCRDLRRGSDLLQKGDAAGGLIDAGAVARAPARGGGFRPIMLGCVDPSCALTF